MKPKRARVDMGATDPHSVRNRKRGGGEGRDGVKLSALQIYFAWLSV